MLVRKTNDRKEGEEAKARTSFVIEGIKINIIYHFKHQSLKNEKKLMTLKTGKEVLQYILIHY